MICGNMEELGEGAAEIVPHRHRDALAFLGAHLGIGEREIVERAAVTLQSRRDQPPAPTEKRRGGLQRQRRDPRRNEPKRREFNPFARRRPTTLQAENPIGPSREAPECAARVERQERTAIRRGYVREEGGFRTADASLLPLREKMSAKPSA